MLTLLALVLLASLGLAGARIWAVSQPPGAIGGEEYRPSGDGLVVRVDTFCRVEHRAPEVEETRRRVVVTALVEHIDPWDVVGDCPEGRRSPGVEVTLERKLGTRRVYDGECVGSLGIDDRCLRGIGRRPGAAAG